MLAAMMNSGKAFKAAVRMIVVTLIILAVVWLLGYLAYLIGAAVKLLPYYLFPLWIVFVLFVLYFFRDPDPIAPSDPDAIVAPGHGTVDVVDETSESEVMGGPCKRISIFLSVFNVHVQNAPVHGKVSYLQHKPGQFVNAMRTDSAQHNENVLIGFEPVGRPGNKVGLRLIAGLIARRIIPWIKTGEVIPRSERISLIQFGSRVELYLPPSVTIRAKVGDKVVGGQTIVATFQ
jgi:phosphatidylserine decarboxylase